MASHSFTFDGVERAVNLILRAQAASPGALSLSDLAAEWEISARTARRIVERAVEATAENPGGRLHLEGRGRKAQVAWVPRGGGPRGRRADIPTLLAALGPWRSAGMEDVAEVLRRILGQVAADAGTALDVPDLLERGFYYQPYMPRQVRDEAVVSEVLSAILYRRGLEVASYHGRGRPPEPLVLLPWTLVHAMDGLYVLGIREGDRISEPRIWALHRMEGARWRPDLYVALPQGYHPRKYLGHGYGPFLGKAGRTELRVPAEEAGWVLESPLPSQVGEPQVLPDGSFLVILGMASHPGLELWARGNGVEIRRRRGSRG